MHTSLQQYLLLASDEGCRHDHEDDVRALRGYRNLGRRNDQVAQPDARKVRRVLVRAAQTPNNGRFRHGRSAGPRFQAENAAD